MKINFDKGLADVGKAISQIEDLEKVRINA